MKLMHHKTEKVSFVMELLFLFMFSNFVSSREEVICGSKIWKNDPFKWVNKQQKPHENCTVIDGDLFIVLHTSSKLSHDDYLNYRMPNLLEITGSLLVFEVKGLKNLGDLLPNLRIIRGQRLIFNYAFIVYQNPDLEEINLPLLQEIGQGGVRIARNPKLCYADTIDWRLITHESASQIYIADNGKNGMQIIRL